MFQRSNTSIVGLEGNNWIPPTTRRDEAIPSASRSHYAQNSASWTKMWKFARLHQALWRTTITRQFCCQWNSANFDFFFFHGKKSSWYLLASIWLVSVQSATNRADTNCIRITLCCTGFITVVFKLKDVSLEVSLHMMSPNTPKTFPFRFWACVASRV